MTSHAHDPVLTEDDLAELLAPYTGPWLSGAGVSAPSAVHTYLTRVRLAGGSLAEPAAVLFTGLGTTTVTRRHLVDLLMERDHLLRRLDEVCPEHVACGACGTALCEPCKVGEISACCHDSANRFCVGCDIESCSECSRELRPFTVGGVR